MSEYFSRCFVFFLLGEEFMKMSLFMELICSILLISVYQAGKHISLWHFLQLLKGSRKNTLHAQELFFKI